MTGPLHERYLAIRVVMMPRDTNPHGTIFGGVLLSYIDQAGAIGAHHEVDASSWTERPFVTVAMNSVEFHHPVLVGDVVSFYTSVIRVGRTSITMHVTVEKEAEGLVVRLTEAEVTYVAVTPGEQGIQPAPIRGE